MASGDHIRTETGCPGLINAVLYKLLALVHLGNKPGVMKSDNDIDVDLCSIIRKLLLLFLLL